VSSHEVPDPIEHELMQFIRFIGSPTQMPTSFRLGQS
jgi:hypothetical protein